MWRRAINFNYLRNQSGFTLLETVLGWIVLGIVALTFVYLLRAGADSFAMISSRKDALAQARFAAERITRELLTIKSADMLGISATSFQFKDSGGTDTDFHSVPQGTAFQLMRGTDVLATNLSGFSFTYYDSVGNEVVNYANIASVVRIRVNLAVTSANGFGDIGVRSEIYPRNFYYSNYQ